MTASQMLRDAALDHPISRELRAALEGRPSALNASDRAMLALIENASFVEEGEE